MKDTVVNLKSPRLKSAFTKILRFFWRQLYIFYIYKSDCLYQCTYLCPLFAPKPPDQSPPNFAQTSPPTQGRFLTQAWPHQLDPPDPGVPQTLKPKWATGEKTLCNVKCPDGWRKLIKFFPVSARAQLASFYIKNRLLVPISLFRAWTARPISTKFSIDLHTDSGKVLNTSMTQPIYPLTPEYPKLQKLSRSRREKLCFT